MARGATATDKTKAARAKQLRLEGMQPKKIQEIEDAAEAYDEAVTERMGLTEKEVAAHDELLRTMEKAGVQEYRRGNTVYRVNEGKRKVKRVRVVEKDGEAEGETTDGLEGESSAGEKD
jgi:hypothetical protein